MMLLSHRTVTYDGACVRITSRLKKTNSRVLCLLGRSDARHSIQDVRCACDWGKAIPMLLQSFKPTSSLERGQDISCIL